MSRPATAREALMVETIGELAELIQRVEALAPALDGTRAELLKANAALEHEVAGLQNRMAEVTEIARTQVVRYIAQRAEEAARKALDQQSRAMADAARVAFGAELGATMQRLQTTLLPLIEDQQRRWERWLVHAATVVVSVTVTAWLVIALMRH